MERETGIEPALVAWKATVLPLNYSRPGVLLNMPEESGSFRASRPPPLRGRTASRHAPNRFWQFGRTTLGGSNPPSAIHFENLFGGGRWIRTTEGMSQQIYSLPPLAAWVSLHGAAYFRGARLPLSRIVLLFMRTGCVSRPDGRRRGSGRFPVRCSCPAPSASARTPRGPCRRRSAAAISAPESAFRPGRWQP